MNKQVTLRSKPAPRRLLWRCVRFGGVCVVLVAVLVLVALWTMSRSWFIIAQVKPELERRLGGEVTIGHARYDWKGGFIIRDTTLRSPEHAGTAGEIARIGTMVVSVDTRELYSGRVHVLALELHDALLRISEDANESGRFAFDALEKDWTDADPGRTRPPRVEIKQAVLEYGTHDGSQYAMRGQRHVSGVMHAAANDDPDGHWYNFLLGEVKTGANASVDGLAIRGRWNAATHQVFARIDGLKLSESTYKMCPQDVRSWWDHMDLEGQVANAKVWWDGQSGIEVEWEIMDVGLTLPVEPGEWARYHEGRIIGASGRQRMRVHSGTIRLRGNELVLDKLVGELKSPDGTAGVPYSVTMRLPQLPIITDWPDADGREAFMAEAMRYAPFYVQFDLENFRIEPDEHGDVQAVDLPLQVAEMLQRFSITDWTISTSIRISRAPARVNGSDSLQSQPIEISGELSIHDASGSFDRFPYPLSEVDADITFTQDGTKVHHVRGTSPNGATVHIAGDIAPLGRNPRIDLRLIAKDAPIDNLLREALPEAYTAVFDGLMHEPSEAMLRDSGLLLDEFAVDELHAEREQLLVLIASGLADEAAQQRLARVDAMIEAGAFELGGTVDLDLYIHRELGPNQRTQVGGEVAINRLDAIIRYFPYPFSIRGGTIHWGPEGATLIGEDEAGLPVITQRGGRGFIRGEFRREVREAAPDLITPDVHIDVAGDTVSELLYASIPDREAQDDAADGEPAGASRLSQSARLLRAIGFEGAMSYQGAVTRGPDGKIGYDFHVKLVDGTAEPTEDLAEALGSAGLLWPSAWRWHDVNVHVRVGPRAVELVEFTGRRNASAVAAHGMLDIRGDNASLDVRFTDLALDRYLLDLFPEPRRAKADQLWATYDPAGSFNAHLQFHKRGDRIHPPRLYIEPTKVSVQIGGERVVLTHQDGRVDVQEKTVRFDGLQLDLSRGAISDGTLALEGTYREADDGRDLHVRGTWQNGRLESPIIGELLRLLKATEHSDRLAALQPQGVFDAQFRYGATDDHSDEYELIVRPRTLSAMSQGERLEVQLNDQSRVRFAPGRIDLLEVSGAHDAGTFQLAGAIHLARGVEATLNFDHVGPLSSPFAKALLPDGIRKSLQQVQYRDGPATRVHDARLRLAQSAIGNAWHVDFRGTLNTDRAEIESGVNIREIDGEFEIAVNLEPDEAPQVSIDALVHRMLVFDRELTNVVASDIALSPDGRTFILPEARGDAYGGAIRGDAMIGVGENRAYSANVNFVGVSLRHLIDGPRDARSASRNTRSPRGELYGGLQLSGLRGRPETRSGRGSARAIGGGLANVPLVLQLVQLLQLTVPLRGDMDHADLVFYIDGDRAVFERILLESTLGSAATLQLIGNGELNLSTFELDTQFRSRSGILVIRDLVGGLSDQLYVIEVTGTVAKPRARVVPLPGITQPDRSRQQPTASVYREPTR